MSESKEGSVKDLSVYRSENAQEDLKRAKREYEAGDYKLTMNRSYYAIFHAMRAVNILDEFDSSKHSGVIAHFNRCRVKSGDFPKKISKKITEAREVRQKSDYDDSYIASAAHGRFRHLCHTGIYPSINSSVIICKSLIGSSPPRR